MIFVGSVLGGPELESCPFAAVLSQSQFPEPGQPWPESGDAPDPRGYREPSDPRDVGSLDVVFHLPGSLVKPDYQGLRTGRFSRSQRSLQVQIAVPQSEIDSTDPRRFILDSIREAIHTGESRFSKAGIRYPKEEYLQLLDTLQQRLEQWRA